MLEAESRVDGLQVPDALGRMRGMAGALQEAQE